MDEALYLQIARTISYKTGRALVTQMKLDFRERGTAYDVEVSNKLDDS